MHRTQPRPLGVPCLIDAAFFARQVHRHQAPDDRQRPAMHDDDGVLGIPGAMRPTHRRQHGPASAVSNVGLSYIGRVLARGHAISESGLYGNTKDLPCMSMAYMHPCCAYYMQMSASLHLQRCRPNAKSPSTLSPSLPMLPRRAGQQATDV